MNGRARLRRLACPPAGQAGQALVITVLSLTVLLGMTGLVIDGSNLQETRRQLQNAADAAAFAGAHDLPASPSSATADALTYLTDNGSQQSEVVTNAVSTTSTSNDTITVKLQRKPATFIMQLLGFAGANVTATARVQVMPVTGMSTSDANYMPYDVWFEDLNGNLHKVGDIVPFRSDAWVQENVSQNNPNWNSNSNSFKGYSPASGGQVNIGDVIPAGTGNKCGQEPIAQLQQIYSDGGTITVPIIDYGSGNGSNLDVTIVGFATLSLNVPNQSINQGCGQGDFLGKIVGIAKSRGITGGSPPQSWASCGTGIGACKPVLTQ
ncbi:MAG TPA: Tad domain-containing protein [Dehalococcoidia bacterium]|jgi:hypothetical protein|nr:Tad domain-containing protein [Dehalococcoidia bacterium]